MKKLIFIFIFALAFTSYHHATSSRTSVDVTIQADSGRLLDDVFVREVLCDEGTDVKSLRKYITVTKSAEEVTVRFNRHVGNASIVILDEKGISCSECFTDGAAGTIEYLPTPVHSGAYTIRVENLRYTGIGEFYIP